MLAKPGRYLLIGDTTDIDHFWHQATTGLGILGRGDGRGMQLHNCLMYDSVEKQICGAAGALIYHRKRAPKGETRTQRLDRDRESDIWGQLVDSVGRAPEGSQWIHVVVVQEVDAPKGVKPIYWVLLTSLPVETFEDAWQVIEDYENRWLVKEYHKVIKSACVIEQHALRTAARLEPLIGLISVIGIRLFQLKLIGRN